MARMRITCLLVAFAASSSILADTPDPVTLLKKVESARHDIASGRIDLTVTRRMAHPPKRGVDRARLMVVFDGSNRRCDHFQRELIIDGSGPDGGEARRKKLDELEGDRDAFVQLGLGQWQESHYCSIYDGSRLLQYDGQSTVVADPSRGSSAYAFDPRILGLCASFFVDASVGYFLGLKDARAVSLIGQEIIDGQPAWHVRVLPKRDDEQRHFWIDCKRSGRVIRYERVRPNTKIVVKSDYDRDDPLPTKVEISESRNGNSIFSTTFLQTRAEFNIPTDPKWWTLAGLGMAVGTPVSDLRIRQRIGYWDGSGLSEHLPDGTKHQRLTPPPHSGKLLGVAQQHPKSDLALDAVAWVIANTPDGPDVQKATDILIRNHVKDERLNVVCERLRGSRSKTAERILRAVLEFNPHREVQAVACFALASNLKQESERAAERLSDATSYAEEAQTLFERLLDKYADVVHSGGPLGELVRPELDELRTLGIGALAPEIVGKDVDERQFKLSDYRGHVVVLTFSANWCSACVAMYPQERSLLERYKDRKFAIVSVSGDAQIDTLRKSIEDGQITWRCWWDGRDQEISTAWNVKSWPAVYVLDAEGVVRFKNVRGDNLEKAIETLLGELRDAADAQTDSQR